MNPSTHQSSSARQRVLSALALAGALLLTGCSSSSTDTTTDTTTGVAVVTESSPIGSDSAEGPAESQSAPLAATWGGTVEGTDAFVAVASNGTEVMAYVCDGKSIATWFKAADGSDGVNLASGDLAITSGTLTLQTKLTTDALSGSIILADGSSHKLVGTRLSGDAGLYRSEEKIDGEDNVGGWVVLSDGQLRGALLGPNAAFVGLNALRSSARLLGPDTPY